MKKVSFEVVNKGNKEELLKRLEADETTLSLLKEKGIFKETIEDNLVAVSKWIEDREFCDKCKGLFMCNKSIKGYHYDLDENCLEVLQPCAYYQDNCRKLAHKKNYWICQLSDKELLNSFENIDLDKEDQYYKNVVELLQQWLNSDSKKGFYIEGKLGVGKTFLACCVSNAYAKKGKKVCFIKMPNFTQQLKTNLDDKDYINQTLKKAYNCDLLVLDDFGAENITAWIRDEIVLPILDYRMENEKVTFFTSNCSEEELRKRLASLSVVDYVKADRILERIRTLSNNLIITGSSRRG